MLSATSGAYHPTMPSVTAVISTYQRPDACERALRSALEQQPRPLEVLVCDDGSRDETAARFRAWEAREPRVRYLRVESNAGTPGPTRNLGTVEARGELVAYLDDDDYWLPGKLERQLQLCAEADVLAGNALREDGTTYFDGAPPVLRPTRSDLIADNRIVMSTAVAPRQMILDAGGFLSERWARGVADYGMWLSLADRDARFAVVGAPVAVYESQQADRMSAAPARQELAVARLAWRRARARPGDAAARRAALRRTVAAAEFGFAAVRNRAARAR